MDATKKAELVAIFKYGLIAPALHMSSKERNAYFLDLQGKEFDVPHYGRKKYRIDTFRNWLMHYKNGGIENLKPAIRSDKGILRRISDKNIKIIKKTIEEFPDLSCVGIYRMLIRRGYVQPGEFGETTLRNYIKNHNLRDTNKEQIGRKKFEKENVNELWICDFLYGPYLRVGKKRKRTYLCAAIDDHSRMIVGWGWYFFENCDVLASTLKEAVSTYGIPNVVYCDNGSVFVSNYLHLVCAKLGIALIHSRPYDSPSRGKIERFFRTVRQKFLAAASDVINISLEDLNIEFEQWLDCQYHKQLHTGINERPIDRYFNNASKNKIKTMPPHELDNCFLNVITRKVKNDATISINKKLYEVPPTFIGKKVSLSFPIDQPDNITLMDNDKPLMRIKPVNIHENANKPHTGIHFKNIENHPNLNEGGNDSD